MDLRSNVNEVPAKNINILKIKIVDTDRPATEELNVLNPPVDRVVRAWLNESKNDIPEINNNMV